MLVHNYDYQGIYLMTDEADINPMEIGKFLIPAYSTVIELPQYSDREIPVFENGTWIIKADYRGINGCLIDESGIFLNKHEFKIGELPTALVILANEPEALIHFYKTIWDGFHWVEGLTQAEIDIVRAPVVLPPSLEDRMAAVEEMMLWSI